MATKAAAKPVEPEPVAAESGRRKADRRVEADPKPAEGATERRGAERRGVAAVVPETEEEPEPGKPPTPAQEEGLAAQLLRRAMRDLDSKDPVKAPAGAAAKEDEPEKPPVTWGRLQRAIFGKAPE